MSGRPPPEKPKRRIQAEFIPFTGQLLDQHTSADGSIYVRVAFNLPAAAAATLTGAPAGDTNAAGALSIDGSSLPEAAATAAAAAADGVDQSSLSSSSAAAGVVVAPATARQGEVLSPEEAAAIVDAEFIFPEGDSIVNIRAASRGAPTLATAKVQLDFDEGFVLDRNLAKQQMDNLRRALR